MVRINRSKTISPNTASKRSASNPRHCQSSLAESPISTTIMVNICDTVLCLPSRSALRTTCCSRATNRKPVTRNSREIISNTIQAGTRAAPKPLSISTKQINAAATSTLSASGSRRAPNVVSHPRVRANHPSSQSVKLAITKMARAVVLR